MKFIESKEDALAILHEIDDELKELGQIVICGTAAILLQGKGFRKTKAIDIINDTKPVLKRIVAKISSSDKVTFGARDKIRLLSDYEKRLVAVEDGFKYLDVKVLSEKDWAASKLTSPGMPDLWEQDIVDEALLQWVEENMSLYPEEHRERALQDLKAVMGMVQVKQLRGCDLDTCIYYNVYTRKCALGYTKGSAQCPNRTV